VHGFVGTLLALDANRESFIGQDVLALPLVLVLSP
jgi:hypothetical protein